MFDLEKTQDLGPIFNAFDEDKNSLSKIGNVNFFLPFCLLKQAPSFLYQCPSDQQFVSNIYTMPYFPGKLVQFRTHLRRTFEQ